MKIDPEIIKSILFIKKFAEILLLALGLGIITLGIEILLNLK